MRDEDAIVHEIFRKVSGDLTQQYLRFLKEHPVSEIQTRHGPWSYLSSGQGEACLLLLAGGARFADTWFGLIQALEDDYRIISTTDPGVSTMAALVEGTTAVLDAEGVRRVHVLGTSFGGLLAQCLTRAHPDRVATMILSNTLVPSAIPARLMAIALKVARFYPTPMLQQSTRWNMRFLMSTTPPTRAFWKAFWKAKARGPLRKMTRAQALSPYEVGLDLATHYRFSVDDLKFWRGAVYLIESADDIGYIRRAAPELRALYPAAPVHRFRRAGHTPGYSRPDAYARVIRSFLEG